MKIQHIAEAPACGIQTCPRCGKTIKDNRGAMVEVGTGPLLFFAVGPVFVEGNCWMASVNSPKEYSNCEREGNA